MKRITLMVLALFITFIPCWHFCAIFMITPPIRQSLTVARRPWWRGARLRDGGWRVNQGRHARRGFVVPFLLGNIILRARARRRRRFHIPLILYLLRNGIILRSVTSLHITRSLSLVLQIQRQPLKLSIGDGFIDAFPDPWCAVIP